MTDENVSYSIGLGNEIPMDDKKKQIQNLLSAPLVAWPTVIIFGLCISLIFTTSHLAIIDELSLSFATIINGITIYFLFSAVHDSAHFAISRVHWFNNLFGHVGMLFFGPLAPLDLARWIHNQHHRHTNEPHLDPDFYAHKIDIFTPVRWCFFDYYYTSFFLKQAGSVRRKFLPRLILQLTFIISVIAASIYAQSFLELLFLWILPTRVSSFLFVLVFSYLPHVPFLATAAQNKYQASSNREGFEWLFTPLMTFQNYHLVHHLYPRAPFYRMKRLWNLNLDEHLSNGPLIMRNFSLIPQPNNTEALGSAVATGTVDKK